MITADGRRFLKSYMVGQSGTIIGAISVGIGNTAATLNDTRLQFEMARVPVAISAYDYNTDEMVFKGTLDENVAGKIYEVAVWTAESNGAPGSQGGTLLTSFDSESEEWTNETFETSVARLGPDSLKHTPAASATSSSALAGINFDFIDYSSQDMFVLAYNVDNANTANIQIRLKTDASNYYQFTITSPTTGYKFAQFTKGSAAVTGVPNWGDITEIEMRTTATSGGSASVEFDGLRLEDVDSVAPTYGMIARHVLALPTVKTEGTIQDIEFAIPVTI